MDGKLSQWMQAHVHSRAYNPIFIHPYTHTAVLTPTHPYTPILLCSLPHTHTPTHPYCCAHWGCRGSALLRGSSKCSTHSTVCPRLWPAQTPHAAPELRPGGEGGRGFTLLGTSTCTCTYKCYTRNVLY